MIPGYKTIHRIVDRPVVIASRFLTLSRGIRKLKRNAFHSLQAMALHGFADVTQDRVSE
jgi:hypothetical protein